MPELRKDPVTGRWIILRSDHHEQEFHQDVFQKSSRVCAFCPGNESMTPEEIFSVRLPQGTKDGSWMVRVIPNKFPALRIEESPDRSAEGIYDRVGGFGAHEVIIEGPDHFAEMRDLPLEHVEQILKVYRHRCLDLRKDSRMRYILIFKNYGQAAGASLEHPHSQLIALPVVPSRVLGELHGAQKHYDRTERCLFCDILRQESAEKSRVVYQENGYMALEPFAARFPFETWILPTSHQSSFDQQSDGQLRALAGTMKATFLKLKKALHDPAFNFMIHTSPVVDKQPESFHWHLEIIPHLTRVAGFELGTGFYVNPTAPEIAASKLRDF